MENKNIKTFENFTKTLNELDLSKEDFSRYDRYIDEISDFKKSLKNVDNEIKKLTIELSNIDKNKILFKNGKYNDGTNYEVSFRNINSLIFSISEYIQEIRLNNDELYEYISINYFNGVVNLMFDIGVEKDRFNKFHFPIELPPFLKNIGLGKKILLSAIDNFNFLYFNSEEDSKELKMVVDSLISMNHIYSFMLDNKIFIFKDDFSFIKTKLKEIFKHFAPENYSLDVDFKKKYNININDILK